MNQSVSAELLQHILATVYATIHYDNPLLHAHCSPWTCIPMWFRDTPLIYLWEVQDLKILYFLEIVKNYLEVSEFTQVRLTESNMIIHQFYGLTSQSTIFSSLKMKNCQCPQFTPLWIRSNCANHERLKRKVTAQHVKVNGEKGSGTVVWKHGTFVRCSILNFFF